MNGKFFMPIDSKCLPIYFGNACIAPSKYYVNKLEDIQNKYPNHILLSDKLCSINTDTCLEVFLNQHEIHELVKINSNLFILDRPLPISRICLIYFSSLSQLEYTITNINLSTAFVPKRLLKVNDKFEKINFEILEKYNDINTYDWNDELKKFNSILGGFALMKTSGEDYMNFSENYFSTLSYFNKQIEYALNKSGHKINPIYFDAFTGNSGFKKLYNVLNKEIEEIDLINIAKEENQEIVKDKFTKFIEIEGLKKATLITAILYSYGVGEESKNKKIDGLILSNFKSELPSDKSEVIALCYGLNRGYSIFQNEYRLGELQNTIKFKLDNKLDYYTIESIYQFAFNKIKTDSFDFIDSINFGNNGNISKIKSTDYYILDTLVIGKKKPKVLSKEYLSNLLQSFFQKDNEQYFVLLFEKIISILYNDISEEIIDDNLSSQEAIVNRLNAVIDEKQSLIINLESKIYELNNLHSVKNKIDKSGLVSNETETKNKIEIINLVENYLKKTKPELEREAKVKGLKFKGNSTSKDDIIIMLLKHNGSASNELNLTYN